MDTLERQHDSDLVTKAVSGQSAPAAITLPYDFDTSGVVRLTMRGMFGLLAVLLVGIIYSLLVSQDRTAALALLISAAILAYFGRLFLRNLIGSAGTITADAVSVDSPRVLGFRLAGPAGKFPINHFTTVRVERVTNPIGIPLETQIGPHERVSLIGKKGTPDILIARTDDDEGPRVGQELAAALGLLYQDEIAPY
jgi:hypothetical protein